MPFAVVLTLRVRESIGVRMSVYATSVCLLFSLFLSVSAFAAPQAVDSRIDEVTVYTSGATVTRVAKVSLNAGDTVLKFSGLSSELDRRRVQVELLGEGASLGQVKFSDVQQRDAFDARVRELQGRIEALEDKIARINDSTRTAELKLKFLEGIAQGYAKESWFEGARGNADISSWRGALEVLDEGSAAARAGIRDNAQLKREAERDLSQLQREMQQLRGKRKVSTDVLVTVASASAQTVEIKLHYFQRNAGWSPQYVANLDSDNRRLQLTQKAEVGQNTDEDWRGVALTLTTSEPSGAMQAPEVQSEFLRLRDAMVPMAEDTAASGVRKLAASRVMEEVVVQAAAPDTADIDVGAYTVTYQVPGRVDVANDSDEDATFDLAEMSFTTELVTRIVPRESADAFLVAKFTYDEELPLYANNMLVYVDQVFVGETWLPPALPQDEITLPVGQDRRVEFSVRNQGGRSGESGFIGRRKQELISNLFEITNRRDSDTVLEVFDRYPTAVDDDIEVTIPREATPPTETDFDDKPGVIVWRKTLRGAESWNISHQYEISYPADKALISRPR